ncbi:MAG: hypothetical protein JW870_17440 [Candidatus Delongbacteria bacterium]|nr:hypothetical protein [Candidatus Delongbacteria bacterium]
MQSNNGNLIKEGNSIKEVSAILKNIVGKNIKIFEINDSEGPSRNAVPDDEKELFTSIWNTN